MPTNSTPADEPAPDLDPAAHLAEMAKRAEEANAQAEQVQVAAAAAPQLPADGE